MTFVTICGKCGRGFTGDSAKALIDTTPLWWLGSSEEEGPRCDGRLIRVNRMSQIEKVHHDPVLKPEEVHIG